MPPWMPGDCYWPQALAVGALLGYASYRDARYREVDPYYWAVAFYALSPLAVLCWAQVLLSPVRAAVVVGDLAAVLVVGALVYFYMLGGADFYATALIAYALPAARDGFPTALAALLYASIAGALLTVAFCLYNATVNRGKASRAGGWLPYCFLGVAVTVREAFERPWWYPLTGPRGNWGYVDEDPHELLSLVAGERGEDAVIWASPGLPFIAFILAGFAVACLLGARPLAWLLEVLAR
ncbi:hypothetical protein [Stetteria hydrogenophila]